MSQTYDFGEDFGLAWWMPSELGQLWYKSHPKDKMPPDGWLQCQHSCDGHRVEFLHGWVKPVTPSKMAVKLLSDIANQVFAKGCKSTNLDYGADPEHRLAYTLFLNQHGLESGDMSMLMCGVYPLAPTKANLLTLGAEVSEIPTDALLLVLG